MDRLIVTGGRLDHRADVATAVWGFDILRYTDPRLGLRVIGRGPERGRLMRFARAGYGDDDLTVPPTLFGSVPAAQLATAEQVWVPHRSGGEKLALAAMAAGRPVLAADTPELRATLGDRARLAALARRLLDRPDEAAALGEAGRRRGIERFPAWRMADALAAVYHEAGTLPAD
jgi:glycosyltransferase involved in cell wall biosynthesis